MVLTNRNNNLKKYCKWQGWNKPRNINVSVYGYSINIPIPEEDRERTIKQVKEDLGFEIMFNDNRNNKRTIVPFYIGDDEPLSWSEFPDSK